MTSNKKQFVIPQLTVHGNVETITQSAEGGKCFDVPLGNISNITPDNVDGVTS